MTILCMSDVAERWKVSKPFLSKQISEGKLKPLQRFKSGIYIFDLDTIKQYEELQRFKVFRRYGIPDFMQDHVDEQK